MSYRPETILSGELSKDRGKKGTIDQIITLMIQGV